MISAVVDQYKELVPSVFSDTVGTGERIGVEMTIDTGSHPPIKQQPYWLPLIKRAVVEKEIDDMLAKGVIRPSMSPLASLITLVPKRDSSIRVCIDYRKMNSITIDDSHPLPHTQDIFDAVQGSFVFTTIDLRSGYWQVPMARNDIPKTAFVTHEWTRMPFGLKKCSCSLSLGYAICHGRCTRGVRACLP